MLNCCWLTQVCPAGSYRSKRLFVERSYFLLLIFENESVCASVCLFKRNFIGISRIKKCQKVSKCLCVSGFVYLYLCVCSTKLSDGDCEIKKFRLYIYTCTNIYANTYIYANLYILIGIQCKSFKVYSSLLPLTAIIL